jgi:serine/threonine-protein kinase
MKSSISPSDWPRLLTLVEQALDMPAQEREAWLRGLDLSALLAQALRGLLDERRSVEAGGFLTALPSLSDSEHLSSPRFAEGNLIGPWRLLRELGQGGMSVVWLAQRHDHQIERTVALKLPHAGPGQELLARRMLRERKILAALEHPNIARLYDVGITGEGTPYLVMEFVPGTHLLAHADAQHLDIRERAALFRQVLAAVQFAHGKLVLHRDLKPSNILVDADGQVKLLDFGIAKLMAGDGDTGDHSQLTRGTERQLTPSYASPEQIQGQALGTASDVYSLGVVLYELLCGQRPHAAPTGSAAQLEAAVLNEEVSLPSRRRADAAMLKARSTTAKALARTLRGDLDAIVLKALAKAPEDRYASAEAFSADLGRWLSGKTVSARGHSVWYPLGKFVRRHRVSLVLGGLAFVALLAASTVAMVQSHTAKQEGERAAAARDFMLQLFEETDPAKLRGVELTASQRLELGRQQAESRLGGQARLQAEVLAGIGEAQLKAGDSSSADAALLTAANFFMATGDRPREAAARLTRLRIAVGETDLEAAASMLAELEPLLPTIRSDRVLHVRWLAVQGAAAFAMHDPKAARKWLEQCIALADLEDPQQIASAFEARLTLSALLALAGAPLSAQDQLKAAEQMPDAGRSLSAVERALGLAEARARLAWSEGGAASIDALPASIARCDTELGARHLICGRLKVRLLNAYMISGETAKMGPLMADGSWWLQRSTSPSVQFTAALTLAQATALLPPIDPKAESLLLLQEMLKPGAQRPLPVDAQLEGLITLAEIQLRMGDPSQAAVWLDRAESLLGRALRKDGHAWHLKLGRALILQSLGRDNEALAAMSALCSIPHRTAQYNLTRLNCVRSLVLTGQGAEAINIASEATEALTKRVGPEVPNAQRARKLLEALKAPGGWRPPHWDGSQIYLAF